MRTTTRANEGTIILITGAAMGMSLGEIDLIAKSLPHVRARHISQALANLPELKSLNLSGSVCDELAKVLSVIITKKNFFNSLAPPPVGYI